MAAVAQPALAMPAILQAPSLAQTPPSPGSGDPPADPLTVFVVTYGEGDAVWERFGHNAVWIRDRDEGTIRSYNWGMFSSDEPNFYPRFLRGQMRYWMESRDAFAEVDAYIAAERSVRLQELALSPAQKIALRDALRETDTHEARFYDYHYYRDNCSTRVRDALDAVLQGQLRGQLEAVPTPETYRTHTLRLTHGAPLVSAGLRVVLGPYVDRPLTAWDEGFIPMRLAERLETVTIRAPDGSVRPLVRMDTLLYEPARAPMPTTPPMAFLPYLLIGGLLGGGLFLLGRQPSRLARTAFAVIGGTWAVVTGLLGLLFAALWSATGHDAAFANENLFQLNPLLLAAGLLLPVAAFRAGGTRRILVGLYGAVLALAVVGIVLQVLPGFTQANAEIIALVLPAHLGLFLALRSLDASGR